MTTPEAITLFGGSVDSLDALRLPAEHLRYLMLETASDGIQFKPTADFQYSLDMTILRLHAFGTGGDLQVRRDEQRLLWRFIGYASVLKLLNLSEGNRFPHALRPADEDERSLLWGEYDTERKMWYENRVGKAPLTYPHNSASPRLEIRARRVLDPEGETVAYWNYRLVDHIPQHEDAK